MTAAKKGVVKRKNFSSIQSDFHGIKFHGNQQTESGGEIHQLSDMEEIQKLFHAGAVSAIADIRIEANAGADDKFVGMVFRLDNAHFQMADVRWRQNDVQRPCRVPFQRKPADKIISGTGGNASKGQMLPAGKPVYKFINGAVSADNDGGAGL